MKLQGPPMGWMPFLVVFLCPALNFVVGLAAVAVTGPDEIGDIRAETLGCRTSRHCRRAGSESQDRARELPVEAR